MGISFNIEQQPSAYQFSENLTDIVIRRNNSAEKFIAIEVSIDDKTLCNDIIFYYDIEGLITIYIREMVVNLIHYDIPNKTNSYNLSQLAIILKDQANQQTSVKCHVIAGGIDQHYNINDDWWQQNFLTWQSQEITMPIWQPQWLTLVKTSVNSRLQILTRLYTAEGIELQEHITEITDNALTRLNVSFLQLWSEIIAERRLMPIAYEVYGVEIEKTTIANPNHPFAQRFVLRNNNYMDKCFLFQNSLGGFDTMVATGISTYIPAGEITTFLNNRVEVELNNSYKSIWQQNTGYIDNERAHRQWREFFNSKNRYFYDNGIWKMIVIDEYEIKHKYADLNSYSFKYHLSKQDECAFYARIELQQAELPTKYFTR